MVIVDSPTRPDDSRTIGRAAELRVRGPTRMSRSVRLTDVMGKYAGPDVVLDFDAAGVLVGIEVIG